MDEQIIDIPLLSVTMFVGSFAVFGIIATITQRRWLSKERIDVVVTLTSAASVLFFLSSLFSILYFLKWPLFGFEIERVLRVGIFQFFSGWVLLLLAIGVLWLTWIKR